MEKIMGQDANGMTTANGLVIARIVLWDMLTEEEQGMLMGVVFNMAFRLMEYEETGLPPDDVKKVLSYVKKAAETIENSDM